MFKFIVFVSSRLNIGLAGMEDRMDYIEILLKIGLATSILTTAAIGGILLVREALTFAGLLVFSGYGKHEYTIIFRNCQTFKSLIARRLVFFATQTYNTKPF